MKLWKDWKDPPTESCSCPSTRAPPPRITWPVKPPSRKNMELCTITLSIMIQVSFYLTEQRVKTHKHQGTFWTNFPFEFTKWIWEINDSSKSVIVVCQAFCLFLWLSGQSLGRTMHGKVKIWHTFLLVNSITIIYHSVKHCITCSRLVRFVNFTFLIWFYVEIDKSMGKKTEKLLLSWLIHSNIVNYSCRNNCLKKSSPVLRLVPKAATEPSLNSFQDPALFSQVTQMWCHFPSLAETEEELL